MTEEQSTRMLILYCASAKHPDPETMRAVDYYDGPFYRSYRKFLREAPAALQNVVLYILSAKYGLISSETVLEPYNVRMTETRAIAMRKAVLAKLYLAIQKHRPYNICIAYSSTYIQAMTGYQKLIPPGTGLYLAKGGIGVQLGKVKKWLYDQIPAAAYTFKASDEPSPEPKEPEATAQLEFDSEPYEPKPEGRFRPISVHVSDMRTFDMCRRRWYFSSGNALNLEPYIPIPALWLGTGVHLGLDAHYQGQDSIEAYDKWLENEWERLRKEHTTIWPEELDKLREQAELGRAMLKHYKLWARTNDRFEVLHTEKKFSMPVKKPGGERALANVLFEGRIDGLVKDAHDRVWVLEHKTAKQYPNETSLEYNDQATGYVLGAHHLFGVRPIGVIFNYLKKWPPQAPHLLKNGRFSINKQQRMSPEVFEATLRTNPDHDIDDPTYKEYLYHLREQPHKFFRRYRVYRTDTEIRELQEKLYWIAREMRAKRTPIWPSNMWYACALGCSFEGPCRAMSTGGDWRALLEAQFRSRDRPEEEEEEIAVTKKGD